MRVTPPPTPIGMFGFLGAPAPPPADTPWTRLASELLDRAVEMRPDDLALHKQLAGELMLPRADLALRYAEAIARLAPDEPEALILLGIVQGLNDQARAAKATLQRAVQLARKRGKSALAQEAQELRRVVGTPMFRTGIQMGLMNMDMGGLDDDFDLDDIEDFF